MKIELRRIKIRDILKGYKDDAENGVFGYSGRLNIRPAYQREFVYKDKQRDAVIDTIRKNFPLNLMYWAENDDGSFEIIDGQQRTISFCQYAGYFIHNETAEGENKQASIFSINEQYFHNLEKEEREQILDYEIMVYVCKGETREKLDWFEIINIAGEKLTKQELRNAIYSGSWLTDAKRHFSKTNCAAYNSGKDYIKGSPIRQDFLETAIKWISNEKVEEYMSNHQHDEIATPLWNHFQNVIAWTKQHFTNYRKEMKGIAWGKLYNEFKNKTLNPEALENEIKLLMEDEDVTKKTGIFPYILTRNERLLSIRTFTDKQKRQAFEKQEGICTKCTQHFELKEMEADHITPWSKGGKTTMENLQMLCKQCNRTKTDI